MHSKLHNFSQIVFPRRWYISVFHMDVLKEYWLSEISNGEYLRLWEIMKIRSKYLLVEFVWKFNVFRHSKSFGSKVRGLANSQKIDLAMRDLATIIYFLKVPEDCIPKIGGFFICVYISPMIKLGNLTRLATKVFKVWGGFCSQPKTIEESVYKNSSKGNFNFLIKLFVKLYNSNAPQLEFWNSYLF